MYKSYRIFILKDQMWNFFATEFSSVKNSRHLLLNQLETIKIQALLGEISILVATENS